MERVCKWCGGSISHMGPKAMFCSNSHKKRSYRGDGHFASKACRVCRKQFSASGRSHRRVVCSDECWKAWDRMIHANTCEFSVSLIGPPKPKKCAVCGTRFMSERSSAKNCSPEYRSYAYRTGQAGMDYRNYYQSSQAAAAFTLSMIHAINQIKGGLTNGNYEPE